MVGRHNNILPGSMVGTILIKETEKCQTNTRGSDDFVIALDIYFQILKYRYIYCHVHAKTKKKVELPLPANFKITVHL